MGVAITCLLLLKFYLYFHSKTKTFDIWNRIYTCHKCYFNVSHLY